MEIRGKVHLMFEQSGVFKSEFKKLGYEAYDYDIQNNFGETDYQIDLFKEIEDAFDGKPSLFDQIRGGRMETSLWHFSLAYTSQVRQIPVITHLKIKTIKT